MITPEKKKSSFFSLGGGGGSGNNTTPSSASSNASGGSNNNIDSPNGRSPQLLVRPSSKAEIALRNKAEKAILKQREDSEILKAQEAVKIQQETNRRNKSWKEDILPIWLDSLDSSSPTSSESLAEITTEYYDNKIRDLCWLGIPSNMRRIVWPLLIGNDLKITPELFNSLRLQVELTSIRSQEDKARMSGDLGGLSSSGASVTESAGNDRSSNSKGDNDSAVNDKDKVGGIANNDGAGAHSDTRESSNSSDPNCSGSGGVDSDGAGRRLEGDIETAATTANASANNNGGNSIDTVSQSSELENGSELSIDRNFSGKVDSNDSALSAELQLRATRMPLTPLFNLNLKQPETVALIEFDLPRTFPLLKFFHDGGPLQMSLEKILQCYAHFRPEIGYVQGMSYLAAVLLLYMDEYEAFTSLSNLICRRGNMDFFQLRKASIDNYVSLFDFFFEKHLPLLFSHMKKEGISTEMYLMDWHLSLFAKTMPLDLVARLWDTYLYDGEVFLVRAGLAILRTFAPRLCTLSLEEIMTFLMRFPEDIDPDELYYNIGQIKISHAKYEQVRSKFNMNNNLFFHSSLNTLKNKLGNGSTTSSPNRQSKMNGADDAMGTGLTSSYGEKRNNTRRSYREDCSLS